MGSETWVQDSTDYGVVPMPTTYFNQTKDNINVLHKGNGQTSVPSAISPDVTRVLDIGDTEETFKVNGTYNLAFITTANRSFGNRIHLIRKSTGGQIDYAASSPPAGSLPIYGNGAGTNGVTWLEERMVTLVLGDTAWHHDMKFT